jgi:glycerol-3-phosphate cytidylyltransferase
MIVGFTCGAFDLFHAGHITMMAECKTKCDYLIVGLHTDPSSERKEKAPNQQHSNNSSQLRK